MSSYISSPVGFTLPLRAIRATRALQYCLLTPSLAAGTIDTDITLIRRLAHLTPTIPVLSKADLFADADQLAKVTARITTSMIESSARLFPLDTSTTTSTTIRTNQPFVVSSGPASAPLSSSTSPMLDSYSDSLELDASILMSSQYTAPLSPSDLPRLVDRLFDPSTTARLRHASAKKFIAWRRSRHRHFTMPAAPPVVDPRRTTGARRCTPTGASQLLHAPYVSAANDDDAPPTLSHARLAHWTGFSSHSPSSSFASASASGSACAATAARAATDATDPLGLLALDARVRRRAARLLRLLLLLGGGCGVGAALGVLVARWWSGAADEGGRERHTAAGWCRRGGGYLFGTGPWFWSSGLV